MVAHPPSLARRLATALLALLALAPSPTLANDPPALIDLDGRPMVEGLDRGDVIVVLWASWSPRCRDIALRLEPLIERWSPRAKVISIAFQEDPETVRRFLEQRSSGPEATERIAQKTRIDTRGAFSKGHGLSTLPSLLVLRDGRPAFRGQLPTDPHSVIEDALAAPSEGVPETPTDREMG